MYVRTAHARCGPYSLGTFWCYGTVQISFADGTFVSASVTFKKEMAAKGGGGGRLEAPEGRRERGSPQFIMATGAGVVGETKPPSPVKKGRGGVH